MASPSRDPRTGIYQFRRVIPVELRPYFEGGKGEYKRSLDTRDAEEAKQAYPAKAALFEKKLAAARRASKSKQLLDAKGMVDAFLSGTDDHTLRGIARKLALLETEAFAHAYGDLTAAPGARYDFGHPPSRDDLDDHVARRQMLEAVEDLQPLPWLETLKRVAALPDLDPIDWAIASIAFQAGVTAEPGDALHEAIGRAYLDRLCQACAVRVDPRRVRLIPSPILIAAGSDGAEPASETPFAELLPLSQAFEAWAAHEERDPKLVDDWRNATRRFVELNGDLPVNRITAKMVRHFRRTLSGLPSRPKKAVGGLPLLKQVEIASEQSLSTLVPATVNKALSCIRVTLEFAKEELEIIEKNVAKDVRSLPTDRIEDKRLPFEPADLQLIYSSPLPTKDGVSPRTLAWVLLLAPFTGGRLDEMGSLRPANVRRYDGIDYIAIEPDRRAKREGSDDPNKRVKTSSAKRDIPIHPTLIKAGFLDYVEERRQAGDEWLFPELEANKHGKRTARLSRVLNDFLDDIGLDDEELVFYSFRHSGKRDIRGKVLGEIVDLLFGHADGSVSSKYGRGADMRTLHDAICQLRYSDVPWQDLFTKGLFASGFARGLSAKN